MDRHKRKRITNKISNFIWSVAIFLGLFALFMFATNGCSGWTSAFMSIF